MSNPRRLTADKIDAAIAMSSELQQPEIIEKLLADEATRNFLASNAEKRKALRDAYQQTLDKVADNLLAISRQVFVELDELNNTNSGDKGPKTHKNVGNYFNYLSDQVQKEILEAENEEARTIAMERFISLAKKALERNDFATLNAIMAGLANTPIYRLTPNWEALSDNAKATHESLKQFLPQAHDAKIFFMENVNTTKPLVPYYGAYLSRFEFGVGRNPSDVVETNAKLAALQENHLQVFENDPDTNKGRYTYASLVSAEQPRISEDDLYKKSKSIYEKPQDNEAVEPARTALLHSSLNAFVIRERMRINKAGQKHIDLLNQIDKLAEYRDSIKAKDELGELRRETTKELISLLELIKTPRLINDRTLTDAIEKLDSILDEKAPQLDRHRHANFLKKRINHDTKLMSMIKETRELLLDAKKEYSEEKNYQEKSAILKDVVKDYKNNFTAYAKLAKLGDKLSVQQTTEKKNLQELLRATHGYIAKEFKLMEFTQPKSNAARAYQAELTVFQNQVVANRANQAANPEFVFLRDGKNNYIKPPVPSREGRGELSIPSEKDEPEAYQAWFKKQVALMREEVMTQRANAKQNVKPAEPELTGWKKATANKESSNRKKKAGEHRLSNLFSPEKTAAALRQREVKAAEDKKFTEEVAKFRAEIKTQREQAAVDKKEPSKPRSSSVTTHIKHFDSLFGKNQEIAKAKKDEQEQKKANPGSPHHRSRKPR